MFPVLDADQLEFQRTVRDFATATGRSEDVRHAMESASGHDDSVWQQMSSQLALPSLTIPESYGGSGFGPVEAAVVFEELGRTLVCSPLFATLALAANAVLQSGDEDACAELLPAIAAGETKATLAITEVDGRIDPDAVQARAERGGDGHLLTGVKTFVIDGAIADLAIVVARTAGGVSLLAVDCAQPGVTRTPSRALDETRKQAWLTFQDAEARLIGEPGGAWPAVTRTLQLAIVSLAAEQVGGAEALLEMTVEYAKSRVQFDRPIGSFQAIKHKCADMLVALESARSAAGYAAWSAAYVPDDLPAAAALAKAYCSDAFVKVAKDALQVHGGIGFTWEHDVHLYLRRAKSSQLLFGTPAEHRETLAGLIGLHEAPLP